jgi:NADPH-dependent F420 reductase
MKLTFIGAGNVGSALANRYEHLRHSVFLGSNNPESKSIQKAVARNPNLKVLGVKDAIMQADVVFLATPFGEVEKILTANKSELKRKILVDCTNPIGQDITHALQSKESVAELAQRLLPESKVVKAFNHMTSNILEDNKFPNANVKPLMFYCGNDQASKDVVGDLIKELGFDAIDAGPLKNSLHLEHLALLYINMMWGGGQSREMAFSLLRR